MLEESIKSIKSFTPKAVLNLYIVYEINSWFQYASVDFALGKFLYRAVNANSEKCFYSWYSVEFDVCGFFQYLMVVGLVKV